MTDSDGESSDGSMPPLVSRSSSDGEEPSVARPPQPAAAQAAAQLQEEAGVDGTTYSSCGCLPVFSHLAFLWGGGGGAARDGGAAARRAADAPPGRDLVVGQGLKSYWSDFDVGAAPCRPYAIGRSKMAALVQSNCGSGVMMGAPGAIVYSSD